MTDAVRTIRVVIDPASAEQGARKVNSALDTIIGRSQAGAAANDNHASSLRRLSGALGDASTRSNGLSRSLSDLDRRTSSTTVSINGLSGRLDALSFVRPALGALTLAGGITAVGTAAMKYQDVLAKISTNVDTTTFSMDALSAGILRQSQAFGQSPVAQAEAAYDIISAGAGSAAEAIDILTSANKLAVGGITTVGVAADGLTSVINAYGSDTLSAASASDAMFIAARDGKTTIDQLAASLGGVAPLAASVGVSFDEVNGAIGVLTKGGIKTAESVTGLKAILSSITKPSKEATDAAKTLGLQFNVAGLRAKGLRGFLEEVAEKTGNSSAKMATLFGGVEALVPVLALTGKGAKDFAATMDSMAHKAGTTDAAVQKMLDGSPSAQRERVISNFTVELTKMGEAIAKAATPMMKWLADNMENLFRVAKAAGTAMVAFGVASMSIKLGGVIADIIRLEMALGATGTFSAIFSAGMKMAQGAVNGLTAALMANPLTALATALTVTLALLWQFRDSITLGNGSLTTLGDLGRAVFESMGPALTAIGDTARSVFGAIGSFFSTAFSGIRDVFKSVFGDLDFSFSGILIGAARINDGMVGLFRGSFRAIGAIWDNLPALLGPNIMAILNAAKTVVVGIGNAVASVYNGIVGFGRSVASTFGTIFNSVATFIEMWANKAISAINGVIGGANKLGAGLAPLATISIGKVAAPTPEVAAFQAAGKKVKDAFLSGFGNDAENMVKGLLGRADAIGRKRRSDGARTAGSGGVAALGSTADDSPFADKGKGSGGKSNAQSDAEKRQKAEDEFWKTLKAEVETAKLLPLAAEDYKKELELQKILGRDLVAGEKQRVDSLLQQARTAKFITEALDTHNRAVLENGKAQELINKRLTGMSEEQLSVEGKLLDNRIAAQLRGVDLQSDAFKLSEQQLRSDLDRASALGLINKGLDDQRAKQKALVDGGVGVFGKYSRNAGLTSQQAGFDNDRASATAYYDANKGSKYGPNLDEFERQYKQTLKGIATAELQAQADIKSEWIDAIDQIASNFDGKFGAILDGIAGALQAFRSIGTTNDTSVLGGIANMLGGSVLSGYQKQGAAQTAALGDAIKNPLNSLKGGFSDFKSMFTNPGEGGFASILGKGMAKVSAGLEIGNAVAGIGKALGLKGGETGAKIGGAVGGLFGPIGAAIGSIGGSLISSLFYKAPKGQANITGVNAGDVRLSGNNGQLKTAASGMAGGVQEGLANIASQLGATIGAFNVSIGMYKKDIRVNATGGAVGGKKGSGAITYGSEAEAVKAAIGFAIKQGALQGLSDFASKAVNALDIESAIQVVSDFKSVMNDFAAITDPITAAVKGVTENLDTLRASMVKVGASSSDLTKLDEYRKIKLDEILKDQTASFRSILADLNGDAGAVSSLDQLTGQLKELDGFKSTLASGKAINQDDFNSLVSKIVDNAGNVYGTNTSDYQGIISLLKSVTQSGLDTTTRLFNQASGGATSTVTTQAAQDMNDQVVATIAVGNDYAAQQVQLLAQIAANMGSTNYGYGNANGKTLTY